MAYGLQVTNSLNTSAQYVCDGSSSVKSSPLSLTDLDTGKVGVGTSSPQHALHISGSNKRIVNSGTSSTCYSTINTHNSDSDNIEMVAYGRSASGSYLGQSRSGGMFLGATPNTILAIGTTNDKPLALGTGNTERLRITSDGKVGIGVTNPSHKLTVGGNIMVDGNGCGIVLTSLNGAFTKILRISNSGTIELV